MDIKHGGAVFAVARERGWHWQDVLDFSASINPLGPAPGVREAILGAMDRIAHYPDPYAARLRHVLAGEWNIEPDRILLGNGATELIHFFARVGPEQPVALAAPVFSEFHRAYPNARLLLSGDAWPDAGLVVMTNPVNPTGAAASPPLRNGPAFVDESFLEFSDLPSRMHHGDIVLRSLTKFHALPGLRIGALVGPPDLMRSLQAKREPWQVNVLAEAAAVAAIADKQHQQATRRLVETERSRILRNFSELPGVLLHPTQANFYFASLSYSAAALCDYMLERKILLRNCTGWPGVNGEAVRFAIRTEDENDRLLQIWRTFPCD